MEEAINLFSEKKYHEVLLKLNQIPDSPENHIPLLNLRGVCLMRIGNYEPALCVFASILAEDPTNPEALANKRGIILATQRRVLDTGDELFKSGQFQEALNAYNSIDISDSDPEIRFQFFNNRGAVLMQIGNMSEALVCFRNALQIIPDHIQTLYNEGTALKVVGNLDEALNSFDKCLQISPDFFPGLCGKSEILASLNQFEASIVVADEAIRVNEDQPRSYVQKAFALMKLNRVDESLIEFETALNKGATGAEIHRLYSFALALKGDSFFQEGKNSEAIEYYEKSMTAQPSGSPNQNVLFNHALALLKMEQKERAIQGLNAVISINERNFHAQAALGLVFFQDGKFAQAVQHFKIACQEQSHDIDIRFNYGAALAANNQPEDAAIQFRKILSIDSSHSPSQQALSSIEGALAYNATAALVKSRMEQKRPGLEEATKKADEEMAKLAIEEKETVTREAPQETPVQQVQIENPNSLVHAPRASISSSIIAQTSLEQQSQPLVQMVFPYQQLKFPGPYPEGIDLIQREKYLSDIEFEEVFGMSKICFEQQPKWKQAKKKKELGLF